MLCGQLLFPKNIGQKRFLSPKKLEKSFLQIFGKKSWLQTVSGQLSARKRWATKHSSPVVPYSQKSMSSPDDSAITWWFGQNHQKLVFSTSKKKKLFGATKGGDTTCLNFQRTCQFIWPSRCGAKKLPHWKTWLLSYLAHFFTVFEIFVNSDETVRLLQQ